MNELKDSGMTDWKQVIDEIHKADVVGIRTPIICAPGKNLLPNDRRGAHHACEKLHRKNPSFGKRWKRRLTDMSEKQKFDLYDTLSKRRTSRKYRGEEVAGETLMRILWAGIGKNRAGRGRTAPMPMGDIIIRLYVASKDGVAVYNGDKDALEPVMKNDIRDQIAHQDFVAKASHVIIMTGLFDNYPTKIGDQDRNDWTYATAGTVLQNIYLSAIAHELGTAAIAWIKHEEIERLLSLKNGEKPMFVMPLGK